MNLSEHTAVVVLVQLRFVLTAVAPETYYHFVTYGIPFHLTDYADTIQLYLG